MFEVDIIIDSNDEILRVFDGCGSRIDIGVISKGDKKWFWVEFFFFIKF